MKHPAPARRFARALVACALVALPWLGTGCAARVYQREHLADRIMSFDAQARQEARRMKALEAREGSTGGGGGAGGGCACK